MVSLSGDLDKALDNLSQIFSKMAKKTSENTPEKSSTVDPKEFGKVLENSSKLVEEAKTLAKETKKLSKEVNKLKDLEFMKVFKHPLKFMWFSFLRGLMVGFGSVLGASVVVALFVYLLSKISFVPVVGDFVQDIIEEIQPGATENLPQDNE